MGLLQKYLPLFDRWGVVRRIARFVGMGPYGNQILLDDAYKAVVARQTYVFAGEKSFSLLGLRTWLDESYYSGVTRRSLFRYFQRAFESASTYLRIGVLAQMRLVGWRKAALTISAGKAGYREVLTDDVACCLFAKHLAAPSEYPVGPLVDYLIDLSDAFAGVVH